MSDTSSSEIDRCSECGEPIEGQALYKPSDITTTEDGLEFVEDPDGPFCDTDCRRDYDGE